MVGSLKDIKTSLTAQGAEELFVALIAFKFFSWLQQSPLFAVESPCYIFVVQHIYVQLQTKRTDEPISA